MDKTGKGTGIKTSNGMGIKTSKGMGIKTSNGMGLATDKNYFKFNEYERKRRYLFGDRGKGNNKKKPAPKPPEKKPEEKPEPKPEPEKEKTPTPPPEEEKTPSVVPPLPLADLPTERAEPSTTRLPPIEPLPKLNGNTLGSMQRMLNLFG